MKKCYLILFLLFISFSNSVFSQTKTAKKVIKSKSVKPKQIKTEPRVPLNIGDEYLGGIIYKIYEDGSGGRVFYPSRTDKLVDAKVYLETYNKKMADDYDLQEIFKMGYINKNNCDCDWSGHLWFMDRNITYSLAYAMKASDIFTLPEGYDKSSARTAEIIRYGYETNGYTGGKCYYVPIFMFSGQPRGVKK
jgi:hypothetical protein